MRDIIFDYVVGFIKKIIDWKICILFLSFFLLMVLLLTKLSFIRYSEFKYVAFIGITISPFLSRKLFWGGFYFFQFNGFITLLTSKINTKDDFRKAWSYYCRICYTDNLKRMLSGGIYLKYYFLGLKFNHLLKSFQINLTKGKLQDISFQEDLKFIVFVYHVCDFASSYDVRQHDVIASKLIEKPLCQISFENILNQIIKDCYNDGRGFLSTLALMLLIMIYLRLPNKKKTYVVEFFKCISDLKIGWLNRRVFEVVIATVMMESHPKEKLRELEKELRNAQIEGLDDKYNFRDKVLLAKILHLGLENAE